MTTSKHMLKAIRLLVLGCLLAFSAKAQATITLNVYSPAAGALVGNSLNIGAVVTSTYQIQSITATVAGRLTNLTVDATAGWIGGLSLAGLPHGPQTLSLNATDVFGNSGQTQVSFVHDLPPVLTVLEPSTPSDFAASLSAFTRPALRVRGSATDDDPGGSVVINLYKGDNPRVNSLLLATATNKMDTVVDLSNWDGSFVPLTFLATDSAGQTTMVAKGAYVVANTNVIEVDRVSGTILDVSESNILFTPEPKSNVLESKSRVTGLETILVNDPDIVISGATHTPHGAIFSTSGNELYEVRDGTLIDLGVLSGNLVVKGNYAIWLTGINLMLRDLLAGTSVVVTTNAGNTYNPGDTSNDVAANGDVVYWSNDHKIYRYRNGTSTQVGNGYSPVTDGVNVGYFTDGYPTYFALLDGTNETILGPANVNRAVSGGWTAFSKPGNGQDQVWTRSPHGLQTQRTFFGSTSYLYALGPSGDLMTYSGQLYFNSNASPPIDLGPWNFGAPFWIQGNWYASLGASLVAFVVPSAPAISASGWNTNGQFSFHIAAGLGQHVVTQESTDLFNWTSLSTNFVSTTFGIDASFPPASGSNKKFYRVISVH
jgi:hypothetical protein